MEQDTPKQQDTQTSQVFAKQSVSKKWIITLSLIFMTLIILIASLHHRHPQHQPIAKAETPSTTLLQANQNRLLAQDDQRNLLNSPIDQNRQSPIPPQPPVNANKLHARLNAPMTVFSVQNNRHQPTQRTTQQTAATLSGQDVFAAYANHQPNQVTTIKAQHIPHPTHIIVQGEFIHAVLETAIDSDLPGMVRAVISQPVYAYQGNAPLISAGSRLVGQYAAISSNGQASVRVFIIWNRIITPEGLTMMINSPSADALGRSGSAADAKNSHFIQRFGTASLISLIAAGTANVGVSSGDQYNSAAAYRTALSNSFNNTAKQVLSRQQMIKPTLYIHQGANIVVFVAKDLEIN